MASQPLRRSEPAGVRADLGSYWREGFAIVRGFLGAAEIENIGAAIDQLHAEGVRHGRCFRHGNFFYNVARGRGGETLVRQHDELRALADSYERALARAEPDLTALAKHRWTLARLISAHPAMERLAFGRIANAGANVSRPATRFGVGVIPAPPSVDPGTPAAGPVVVVYVPVYVVGSTMSAPANGHTCTWYVPGASVSEE